MHTVTFEFLGQYRHGSAFHQYLQLRKSFFVDDLASFHVPALLMSGGEPLVRPDILDLAEYATSKGIRVTFSTNGILITEEKAKRMKEIGVTYAGISIDGAEPTRGYWS